MLTSMTLHICVTASPASADAAGRRTRAWYSIARRCMRRKPSAPMRLITSANLAVPVRSMYTGLPWTSRPW